MFSLFLLWLVRGFDKRIVRAANHVTQRSSGSYHGINGVFLLHAEVDQYGLCGFARGPYGGHHLSALGDALAADAKSIGESCKIRRDERRGHVTLVVEEFLPLADHAEIAVVNDGDLDVDFFLDDGGQLTHGHLEAAIADDDPDFGIGLGKFHADGGGKRETHGAEAAGSDKRARAIVMIVLRFPHLVLAHVGDDDGFPARLFPEIVDDVRGVEMAGVRQALNVADGGIALEFRDMANPSAVVARNDVRREFFEDFPRVADESGIHLYVFVDFSAIDLDVNFARGFCVGAKVAGDAIVEAHAYRDEEVRFLNGIVNPGFAVHAHHAEIQRITGREAADAEKRHGDGIVSGA